MWLQDWHSYSVAYSVRAVMLSCFGHYNRSSLLTTLTLTSFSKSLATFQHNNWVITSPFPVAFPSSASSFHQFLEWWLNSSCLSTLDFHRHSLCLQSNQSLPIAFIQMKTDNKNKFLLKILLTERVLVSTSLDNEIIFITAVNTRGLQKVCSLT